MAISRQLIPRFSDLQFIRMRSLIYLHWYELMDVQMEDLNIRVGIAVYWLIVHLPDHRFLMKLTKMKLRQFTYRLFTLALLIVGCEDEFFLIEDKTEPQIVITGNVRQAPGKAVVNVNQTSTTGGIPVPVRGACIILFDNEGNSEELEDEGDGLYLSSGTIVPGIPGNAYHIEVQLVTGNTYRSLPDTMPSFKMEDELSWRQDLETTTSDLGIDIQTETLFTEITSSIPTTDEELFIQWVADEVYQFLPTDFPDPFGTIPPPCYITQPVGAQTIELFTTVSFQGSEYNDPTLFSRPVDDSFLTKHIFSVYQLSMSEQSYTYMNDIKVLTENQGSLFDQPPGLALGNIIPDDPNESAQGFFQALLTDTTRFAVFPDQVTNEFRDPCEYNASRPFGDYPQQCLQCLTVPNSSYTRPSYWLTTN